MNAIELFLLSGHHVSGVERPATRWICRVMLSGVRSPSRTSGIATPGSFRPICGGREGLLISPISTPLGAGVVSVPGPPGFVGPHHLGAPPLPSPMMFRDMSNGQPLKYSLKSRALERLSIPMLSDGPRAFLCVYVGRLMTLNRFPTPPPVWASRPYLFVPKSCATFFYRLMANPGVDTRLEPSTLQLVKISWRVQLCHRSHTYKYLDFPVLYSGVVRPLFVDCTRDNLNLIPRLTSPAVRPKQEHRVR